MEIIKNGEQIKKRKDKTYVFLAGGMGNNWREEVEELIETIPHNNIVILDPYSDTDDIISRTVWESEAIYKSDIFVVYLEKEGLHPMSLYELGKAIAYNKYAVVCIDKDYERYNQLMAELTKSEYIDKYHIMIYSECEPIKAVAGIFTSLDNKIIIDSCK